MADASAAHQQISISEARNIISRRRNGGAKASIISEKYQLAASKHQHQLMANGVPGIRHGSPSKITRKSKYRQSIDKSS